MNDGSNLFSNPDTIIDEYGREQQTETNIYFYPLKENNKNV